MSLVLIRPVREDHKGRLDEVLSHALDGMDVTEINRCEELTPLHGRKILFAVAIGEDGINLEYVKMLSVIRRSPSFFADCEAAVIVDGDTPLYTKSTATELVYTANRSGCAFIGRPLVEGTDTLFNFTIQARNMGCGLLEAYKAACEELMQRLLGQSFARRERAELLVLHASNHKTSNTLSLWDDAKQRLSSRITTNEIALRNGTVTDCSGCPYTMCMHFGEKGSCFYGGVVAEKGYPAFRQCNGVVMLCPNYNDALSANLTAFINRLTSLFRQMRFYDKALFSIVVSGYSGSDIVTRQLISALNMNKSMYLPPRFAMVETANFPGDAMALEGVGERLDGFVRNIERTLLSE